MEKQKEKFPPGRSPGEGHMPRIREEAASQRGSAVALGNMGPVWPYLPSFQETMNLWSQLSQR